MRAGATGTTTTSYPAWTPPLLLHGGGAEPSIRTSPDQRYAAYISAPAAGGSNFWNVREVKKSDGSVVFKRSPVVDTDLGTGGGGIIDAATFPSVANTNQVGNIVTDYSHPIAGMTYPVSNDQVHTLYATFGGPHDVDDNAAANSAGAGNTGNYNHVDTIYLAKSVDGGQTWHDTMVYTTPPATQRELNMLFPVVAVDKVGNVYVMWSDTYRIQYAVSTDGGKTFSNAYQVNRDVPAGSVTPVNGKANLFPWLAAGADGMIDLVWYHGEGGSAIGRGDPGSAGQTKWPG